MDIPEEDNQQVAKRKAIQAMDLAMNTSVKLTFPNCFHLMPGSQQKRLEVDIL